MNTKEQLESAERAITKAHELLPVSPYKALEVLNDYLVAPAIEMPLLGRQIALMAGHEPGGGAEGERDWNLEVLDELADMLEAAGAEVYVHSHTLSSYGARQSSMRDCVNARLPECNAVIELHYNAYDDPDARGHEFLYRGSRTLAECFQKRFAARWPQSVARSGGTKYTPSGNGAGFLEKAPAWGLITEPFFITNADERSTFQHSQREVAEVYFDALVDFLG